MTDLLYEYYFYSLCFTGVLVALFSTPSILRTLCQVVLKLYSWWKGYFSTNYIIRGRLGSGAFSEVSVCFNTNTFQHYAVKRIPFDRNTSLGPIMEEIKIHKIISHDTTNVVAMEDFYISDRAVYIVMELIHGRELFDVITDKGYLSEDKARFYVGQLIQGVAECHNLGIIHADLKPENIVISKNGVLKIIDFGLAFKSGPKNVLRGMTEYYAAPESYDDDTKRISYKLDVWSVGIILYVMTKGHFPFMKANENLCECYKEYRTNKFSLNTLKLSLNLVLLLYRILDPNPDTRVSLEGIKQAYWYRKGI